MKYLLATLGFAAGISFLNLPMPVLGLITLISAGLFWGFGGMISLQALLGKPIHALAGHLQVDQLGGFFLLILTIVGGAVLLYLWGDLLSRREAGQSSRSLTLNLGLTFAFLGVMVLSVSAKNLGLIWVCIEGTTLVSALMIGLENSRSALEAAWKYVILCTVGLTSSLFGLILLVNASSKAGIAGTLDSDTLMASADKMPLPLLKLSFLLMLVGYGTKAGFAPLHSWLPDAYSQANAPTSALLSGALLNCSLYAIIRTGGIMEAAGLGHFVKMCYIGFGLVSIITGTFFLSVQSDLKRLLAYSSVEHLGLITLGLGLGTPLSIFAVTVHVFTHSISKALVFLSAGEMVTFFHSQDMNRMVGTIKRLPWAGGGIAFALASLCGVPPFPLFFTELMLISSAIAIGKTWVGIVVLFCLAIAFAGFAYQGTRILLGEDAEHHHHSSEDDPHEGRQRTNIENLATLEIMIAGKFWRHTSLLFLSVTLLLLPVLFFQPFSGILETVGTLMMGGRL